MTQTVKEAVGGRDAAVVLTAPLRFFSPSLSRLSVYKGLRIFRVGFINIIDGKKKVARMYS